MHVRVRVLVVCVDVCVGVSGCGERSNVTLLKVLPRISSHMHALSRCHEWVRVGTCGCVHTRKFEQLLNISHMQALG